MAPPGSVSLGPTGPFLEPGLRVPGTCDVDPGGSAGACVVAECAGRARGRRRRRRSYGPFTKLHVGSRSRTWHLVTPLVSIPTTCPAWVHLDAAIGHAFSPQDVSEFLDGARCTIPDYECAIPATVLHRSSLLWCLRCLGVMTVWLASIQHASTAC